VSSVVPTQPNDFWSKLLNMLKVTAKVINPSFSFVKHHASSPPISLIRQNHTCNRTHFTSTGTQGLSFKHSTRFLIVDLKKSHEKRLHRVFSNSKRTNHERDHRVIITSVNNYPSLPVNRQKIIGIWLLVIAGMVFLMILLGGITRLTESGLSITDWKPLVGAIPPLSQDEWMVEFDKYKQSPEYQKLNFGMSLEDFTKIFWMEWAHREWGRAIGLAFGLPYLFFLAKGWLHGRVLRNCTALLAFGGLQGAIGYWMVASGLDAKNFEEHNSVPRVSQYRLAIHLVSAVGIYSALIWKGLELLETKAIETNAPALVRLKKLLFLATGVISITAFSGAFVAGLDAGLIYNTFPLMGEQIVPDGMWTKTPLWKNVFENDTTVQFNHRYLGITTVSFIGGLYAYALKHASELPLQVKRGLHALMGVAALQVALGISTLLTFVPVHLAASHQAGAMSLLTVSLWLSHRARRFGKIPF